MVNKCLQCGACCHFVVDGKLVKCKYLIKYPSGKTRCRIYPNRLGTKIYPGFTCGLREHDYRIFPGCPYNRPIVKKDVEEQ